MIVGCKVLSGKVFKDSKLKIVRGKNEEDEDNLIGYGIIKSLKKVDKDVDDIAEGNECGIKFVTDEVIQEGDTLVAFKEEEKHRKIT